MELISGTGNFQTYKSSVFKQEFFNTVTPLKIQKVKKPVFIEVDFSNANVNQQIHQSIAYDERATLTRNAFESMGYTPKLSNPQSVSNLRFSGLINRMPKRFNFDTSTQTSVLTNTAESQFSPLPTNRRHSNLLNFNSNYQGPSLFEAKKLSPIDDSAYGTNSENLRRKSTSSISSRVETPTPGSRNNQFNLNPNQLRKFNEPSPFGKSNMTTRTPISDKSYVPSDNESLDTPIKTKPKKGNAYERLEKNMKKKK